MESIFLRVAEGMQCINRGLGEQLSAQSLMLLFGGRQRKAYALQITDAVALHLIEAFLRLVHCVQNRPQHECLVAAARFIYQRVALEIRAPFDKSDDFKRDHDDDGGHHCRCIKSRAACHADGCDHEYTGSAGEPADAAAIVENKTGAEKTNTLHNV